MNKLPANLLVCWLVFLGVALHAQPLPLEQLMPEFEQQKRDIRQVDLFADIAYNYVWGDAQMAYEYASAGIKLADSLNYAYGLGKCYSEAGLALLYMGHSPEALEYLYESLPSIEAEQNPFWTFTTYSSLGYVEWDQSNYRNALNWLSKAKPYTDIIGNDNYTISVLSDIGETYIRLNSFDSAEVFIDQAIRLARSTSDTFQIGVTSNQLALIRKHQERLEESLTLSKESIRFNNVSGYNSRATYLNIGEIYLQQNIADSAISYAKQAIESAKAGSFVDGNLSAAYLLLSDSYEQKGELDSVIKYLKIGNYTNSLIVNTEKTKHIQGLDFERQLTSTRIEQAKRETMIASDLKRQRLATNVGFAIVALVLLFAGVLANRIRLISAQKKIIENEKELVQKRTEELDHTLEELKETQQFRDQFLANMSHEIRTPMNAIVGLTNLLVKTPLDDTQEKYIEVIQKSGDNLLVIINDILDLSKIEAGKMTLEQYPFNLHKTIGSICTILNVKAREKDIYLKNAMAKDVPEFIKGDETRLTQVLVNLAGNAIKFTETGGVTLEVTVQNKSDNHCSLHFSVKDTGIGIPEDKLQKIFESFSQASSDTTRKYGGTGLGLNISRQLVQLHGGQLDVRSEMGKGSDFFFELTYELSAPPKVEGEAESDDGSVLTGKKILLVEDNPFNQMVAEDTLMDLFPGIEIDIADTGQAAVDKASEGPYHIILMDIQLPDFDGYEATEIIRAGEGPNKEKPICALTANITEESINACYEAGMNDYLLKPFNPAELKQKIIKHSNLNLMEV